MSEIRVENIIGETGTDAVNFTKGINVTGIVTATSFCGSGYSSNNKWMIELIHKVDVLVNAGILQVKQWLQSTKCTF